MFVFSLKSPIKGERLKAILLIVLCVSAVFGAAVCVLHFNKSVPETANIESFGEYNLDAEDDSQRAKFLSQFGFTVDRLYSSKKITLPSEFNATYLSYNDLQLKQGLDLTGYKGEEAMTYIYKLSDCTIDNSQGYATLVVYKGRVVAGHISSLLYGAKMYTFTGE